MERARAGRSKYAEHRIASDLWDSAVAEYHKRSSLGEVCLTLPRNGAPRTGLLITYFPAEFAGTGKEAELGWIASCVDIRRLKERPDALRLVFDFAAGEDDLIRISYFLRRNEDPLYQFVVDKSASAGPAKILRTGESHFTHPSSNRILTIKEAKNQQPNAGRIAELEKDLIRKSRMRGSF